MKIKIYLAIVCLSCTLFINAQDTIVRKNGEYIICKIEKQNSTGVTYTINYAGVSKSCFIEKSFIKELKYEKATPPQKQGFTKMKSSGLSYINETSTGLGLGLEYGGIGINYTQYLEKNFGFFLGVGYNFAGIGLNVGIKARLSEDFPNTPVAPHLFAMYGYNTAIIIKNTPDYNKIFYGVTVGAGLDISLVTSISYLSISALMPFRSEKAEAYRSDLVKNKGITFDKTPNTIQLGYRWV